MSDEVKIVDPAHPDFRMDAWPLYWITRVSRQYAMELDQALKRIGMDVARWRVLMILAEFEQASISVLAEHAVIKLPTMTKTVTRMEQQGLVTTFTNPDDRRVTLVRATQLGREKTDVVRLQASRIFWSAFEDVSPEGTAQLVKTLRKIFANLVNGPESGPESDKAATFTAETQRA